MIDETWYKGTHCNNGTQTYYYKWICRDCQQDMVYRQDEVSKTEIRVCPDCECRFGKILTETGSLPENLQESLKEQPKESDTVLEWRNK